MNVTCERVVLGLLGRLGRVGLMRNAFIMAHEALEDPTARSRFLVHQDTDSRVPL